MSLRIESTTNSNVLKRLFWHPKCVASICILTMTGTAMPLAGCSGEVDTQQGESESAVAVVDDVAFAAVGAVVFVALVGWYVAVNQLTIQRAVEAAVADFRRAGANIQNFMDAKYAEIAAPVSQRLGVALPRTLTDLVNQGPIGWAITGGLLATAIAPRVDASLQEVKVTLQNGIDAVTSMLSALDDLTQINATSGAAREALTSAQGAKNKADDCRADQGMPQNGEPDPCQAEEDALVAARDDLLQRNGRLVDAKEKADANSSITGAQKAEYQRNLQPLFDEIAAFFRSYYK